MRFGAYNMATTIPKKSKKGGGMMRKLEDPVQISELLAWVYADLQRLAREAQEKRTGGDDDAEIQAND